MKFRLTVLSGWIILSLISPFTAGAEEETFSELGGWMEAAEARQQQHPVLQENLREQQEKVERGEVWENPELRLSAGENLKDQEGTGAPEETRYVSTFRLPLPHPWQRKAGQADRLADLHLAEASVEERVMERKWNCLETGLRLQYLQADHQLLSEYLHLLNQTVEQTRNLIDEGVMTRPELTQLQLDALNARQDLLRNRILFYENRRDLSVLTGFPVQTLQITPVSIDPEKLLKRLSGNPFPAPALPPSLLARQEKAKAQKASVRATRIPWFEHVQAQMGSSDQWGDAETAEVQVAVSLPVFSFFDSGARIANETLDFLEVAGRENLHQQNQFQKGVSAELQDLLPQLLTTHREGLQLASRLHELEQNTLPIKDKMKVLAMRLGLIDLQREVLRNQQSLELRLWSLYATEL